MRIAIYNKKLNIGDLPSVTYLLEALHQNNVGIYIYAGLLNSINGSVKLPPIAGTFELHDDFVAHGVDFLISMGGDGTILDCVNIIRDTNVPILGINLGRLGFLANVEVEQIDAAVANLLKGAYSLESRSLLQLECNRPLFGDFNVALNDLTILKRDTSSMVTIHTYINGEFLNSYWADGLIIATPTGSTGYSLSCGGPIIFPNSATFVITPVAPHNLSVRPVVINDDTVISFEVEGRSKKFLCTLDARYETIESIDQLAVRKADFKVSLIRFADKNFLYTLRAKLNWGVDIRN